MPVDSTRDIGLWRYWKSGTDGTFSTIFARRLARMFFAFQNTRALAQQSSGQEWHSSNQSGPSARHNLAQAGRPGKATNRRQYRLRRFIRARLPIPLVVVWNQRRPKGVSIGARLFLRLFPLFDLAHLHPRINRRKVVPRRFPSQVSLNFEAHLKSFYPSRYCLNNGGSQGYFGLYVIPAYG
jgi:hypothetical protein